MEKVNHFYIIIFYNFYFFNILELSSKESATIFSVHRRFQQRFIVIVILFISLALLFSYIHLFFVNAVYEWSVKDVTLWLVVLPLNAISLIYGNFVVHLHF